MSKTITFNNRVYKLRYDGYYQAKQNKKSYMLHRDIYEFHKGVIADNLLVHHKNENKEDNSIENLQTLTRSEHQTHHQYKRMIDSNCKDVITVDSYVKLNCLNCGKMFLPPIIHKTVQKFCSVECRNHFNFTDDSMKVVRNCIECNSEFRPNKYSKTRTCSVKCKVILFKQTRGY